MVELILESGQGEVALLLGKGVEGVMEEMGLL